MSRTQIVEGGGELAGAAGMRQGPPLRIGHFVTVDLSLATLLRTEMETALQHGHEVIGLSAEGPYREQIESLGVAHVTVPHLTRSWGVRSDLLAAYALWRLLPALGLDVLHTHTPKAGVIGRVVGRLRRVPVVINTCHGLWATEDDPWLKRALVVGVESLVARLSDAELFQNPEDERRLSWGLWRKSHEVVGNGTDLCRFVFDAAARARVRAEWRVSTDEIVVGCVGRVVEEKGVREFGLAAAALVGRARFVWVGPDDNDRSVGYRECSPEVHFVGGRKDMPSVYSAFDIFVLPSWREGFPRSAMEAASCGRPLLLTDIRGSREIGESGKDAMYVPPKDVPALVASLVELIGSPARRLELGAAARRRAISAFDQRLVAERSFRTYEAVLERRKGRR